jgi:very-short-patch-repair endonuclease
MAILLTLGIVILFFAAIAGGIAGLIVRLTRAGPSSARPAVVLPNSEPPKADRLPYLKRKYFFSNAERSFYEVLRRLAPAEYTVFAKVRLADLVFVSKGAGSRQSHFNRINRKHIDFLLCNRDLAPVVAIELDDASHDEEDREERDEFVDSVLRSAGLPIVHIRARRGYALDDIRAALHPFLPARAPVDVPHPDERYMPPQGWRPAV